jgi:hypothetical protein
VSEAADAVEAERQRLIGIFREAAWQTREARGKFTNPKSRAAGILAIQEKIWWEAVAVTLGEHRDYPRPVPDIGTERDELVTGSHQFQYIGTARTSVRAGEKVGVWLNEAGAVWALGQVDDREG